MNDFLSNFKGKPDWLDGVPDKKEKPIVSKEVDVPVIPISPVKATTEIWDYPELNDYKEYVALEYEIAFTIKQAISKSIEFRNWFETVSMTLFLNARYTLREVYIPNNFTELVKGARKMNAYILLREPNKIYFSLFK